MKAMAALDNYFKEVEKKKEEVKEVETTQELLSTVKEAFGVLNSTMEDMQEVMVNMKLKNEDENQEGDDE